MKRSIDAAAVIAVTFGLALAIPATLWINVNSVSISNAVVGEDPTVLVDRDIYQSFSGFYTADIRSLASGDIICGRLSGHEYVAGKHGSYNTNLVNYAGGDDRCSRLPAGQYQGEFCWTIQDPFWFVGLGKKTCIKSNVFEVGEMK